MQYVNETGFQNMTVKRRVRTSEREKKVEQADEEWDNHGGKQEPERIFILQRCVVLSEASVFVDLLWDKTEVDTGCE